MLKYYSDDEEENIICVYSDNCNHKKIIKKLENIIGTNFLETTDQEWFDEGAEAFPLDTLVVPLSFFNEDFLELVEVKINVYVTQI